MKKLFIFFVICILNIGILFGKSISTGFDPGKDSWGFKNGDVNIGMDAEGLCSAMSFTAGAFYWIVDYVKKYYNITPKYSLYEYSKNNIKKWDPDFVQIIVNLFNYLNYTKSFSNFAEGLNFAVNLLTTYKVPIVLYLSYGTKGHTILLYEADIINSDDVMCYYYDPNHPGEIRQIEFDPKDKEILYSDIKTPKKIKVLLFDDTLYLLFWKYADILPGGWWDILEAMYFGVGTR